MSLFKGSLALLTDLYQITMAYGYWKSQAHTKMAVFNVFFRENPFAGGYTIVSGLQDVIDFLENLKFTESDLSYLSTLRGVDQQPYFETGFLDFLKDFKFECDVDAVPEGTVLFPNEPIMRIKGPIYQCQMIETPVLNIINFQTLISTKASRIRLAAKDDKVLEFGLRRAQGRDGAISASRAAYIGGCDSTSNLLAGKLFNIPVSGTHAHSWVMSFDSELESFERYAKAMPNNCVLLVDTYDTKLGIEKAIKVGLAMQETQHRLLGLRIDSGDLAYFSTLARKMLDDAGLHDVKVIASNDLDEHLITSLKEQDAQIDVWGIGTKLITAFDQPALGAVYKLSAIKGSDGSWQSKVKLSAQSIKINIPGIQQIRRFYKEDLMVADMIYIEDSELEGNVQIIDPTDPTRRKTIDTNDLGSQQLLVTVIKAGVTVYPSESLDAIRNRHFTGLAQLHKSIKRFTNPHIYPVGLEESLYKLRMELILKLKSEKV